MRPPSYHPSIATRPVNLPEAVREIISFWRGWPPTRRERELEARAIERLAADGSIIEFRSVVDAVRCAIEVQTGMVERNVGLPPEKRIEFRIGIHLGDVVEESDGDLMGDGVNVAARLEGICEPGQICLSEDAYRQVKSRVELQVADLGPQNLKNIAEAPAIGLLGAIRRLPSIPIMSA